MHRHHRKNCDKYKHLADIFSNLFLSSKALSASKVCSEVALKSHPEPQSDSDHDTGGDLEYFNPEDDSIPSAQEVVVEVRYNYDHIHTKYFCFIFVLGLQKKKLPHEKAKSYTIEQFTQ